MTTFIAPEAAYAASGATSHADQLEEGLEVEVAPGHDRDDRPLAGASRARRGDGQRARALRDHARLLGHETHRALRVVEGHDEDAADDRLHPLPHAREDALPSGAVDERSLPPGERLRRPFLERE